VSSELSPLVRQPPNQKIGGGRDTLGFRRPGEEHMERKAAASAEGLRGGTSGRALEKLSHLRWPLGLKGSLLAVAILSLLGLLSLTAIREGTTTSREPIAAGRAVADPPKPAFTRAEETYIQALWPIHGDVERSAVRLSL